MSVLHLIMRKTPSFKSARFSRRFLVGSILCLAGAWLAFSGLLKSSIYAAPAPAGVPIPGTRSELWANSYAALQSSGMNVDRPLAMAVSAATGRIFETATVRGPDGYKQYATIA